MKVFRLGLRHGFFLGDRGVEMYHQNGGDVFVSWVEGGFLKEFVFIKKGKAGDFGGGG